MIALLPVWLPLTLIASPMGVFDVSAKITAKKLEVGKEYEFVVEYQLAKDWSADKAGLPGAIIQIKVPKSVELVGKVLSTHEELSKNGFMYAPFERLVKSSSAKVKFKLKAEPKPDEKFAINVLAYISSSSANSDRFVRRRIEIPLIAGAVSTEVDVMPSDWGETKTLQLGDVAVLPALTPAHPRAVLPLRTLEPYRGKKNLLLFTYRAHW